MDSFVSGSLHQDYEDRMTHRAFKFGWLRVYRTTNLSYNERLKEIEVGTPPSMTPRITILAGQPGQLESKNLHNGSEILKNMV
jgi:hypothetical protein